MIEVNVIGEWNILIYDSKTRKLLDKVTKRNVITTAGKEIFATAMVDGLGQAQRIWGANESHESGESAPVRYVRYPWALLLGTGSGTPAKTDTSLWSVKTVSEKMWKAWDYGVGTLSRSGATLTFFQRYDPEDANGYTYTEAGIYDYITNDDNYASGSLINHVDFGGISKDTSKFLDFYVNLTFMG